MTSTEMYMKIRKRAFLEEMKFKQVYYYSCQHQKTIAALDNKAPNSLGSEASIGLSTKWYSEHTTRSTKAKKGQEKRHACLFPIGVLEFSFGVNFTSA